MVYFSFLSRVVVAVAVALTVIFLTEYDMSRVTAHHRYDRSCSYLLESFAEEPSMVQLQLLTATVKLFLKQPETSQVRHPLSSCHPQSVGDMIRIIYCLPHFFLFLLYLLLALISSHPCPLLTPHPCPLSSHPSLRGYVYWRLLSSDPEAARAVVLSEKPEVTEIYPV